MKHLRLLIILLLFKTHDIFAEHKIVSLIFKFLDPIEDRSTFEQNKPLLKLIWHNRNILFNELTKDNPSPYEISQIFLKLAVFTSENFDKIAPRDRNFYFSKEQLHRFWSFIVKKIKSLINPKHLSPNDIRFKKITSLQDVFEIEEWLAPSSIKTTILHCFHHMFLLNSLVLIYIGNRLGDFKDFMISSRRQLELLASLLQPSQIGTGTTTLL